MFVDTKVIFLHGNGNCTPKDNWFPYVKKELNLLGLNVVAEQFPDSDLARSEFWLPFLKDQLKADSHTILIGHSSGALAAMRYAEENTILGSILVGAMHTDLGMEKERLSGYFDKPWNWKSIKKNQKWTVIFASTDDPWIPIKEPRYIHDKLQCEYHEYIDQGHFGGDYKKLDFPEIIQVIKRKLAL